MKMEGSFARMTLKVNSVNCHLSGKGLKRTETLILESEPAEPQRVCFTVERGDLLLKCAGQV